MRAALLALLLLASPAWASIGLDNHNPGNIRSFKPQVWAGAVGVDKWHHLIFATDLDGLKAMRKVLRAYYYKHHLTNISTIVNRWVRKPANTAEVAQVRGYLLGVAQKAGVKPNQRLWLEDNRMMAKLAKAIVYAENGSQPYPDSLFRTAFQY